MDSLKNFLENLRPGGASNIPKSKFEQSLTQDSDLESNGTQELVNAEKKVESKPAAAELQKSPRKKIVKQVADVHRDSSEYENIHKEETPTKETTVAPVIVSKPTKTPSQNDPKIKDPAKEEIKKVSEDLPVEGRIKKRPQNGTNLLSHSISPVANASTNVDIELFSSLDTNKTGTCDSRKITEYWESGGIIAGWEVLEFLDFSAKDSINLTKLSKELNREMLKADLDAVTLAGIISYQKELQYCRLLLEDTSLTNTRQREKDEKLNVGKTEAMETSLKQEYEAIINELKLNKEELMERIGRLNKEMSNIEFENSHLQNQIVEIQEISIRQEEELDAVADLHRKMEFELKVLRDAKNHDMGAEPAVALLQSKLRRYESKIKELEHKLELKFNEVRYLKKELEDSRFYKMQDENESSANKLREMEKKLSTYIKVNDEYKEENEKLRNKARSLEDKVEIAINREKSYKMKLELTDKESLKARHLENNVVEMNDKLSEKTKQCEIALAKYSQKISELEMENKELRSSYQNVERQMKEIKTERMLDQDEIHKLKGKLQYHKTEIDNLNELLESKKDEFRLNRMLLDKLETANDRLSKSIKRAVEKMDEFLKDNSNSGTKEAAYDDINIRKENMLLEDEISQLNRRISSAEMSQTKEHREEIHNIQQQLRDKERMIEELEYRLHKDQDSERFGSAKKMNQLKFKYDELVKKHQIQLEQVEKSDNLLSELYEENTKLIKSLQRSDMMKEQNEIKIIQLEEKIKTLHGIANRISSSN